MKNRDFRKRTFKIRYKNKPELTFEKECEVINGEFAISHLFKACT
jgi:hypothetical protein